MLSERIRAQKYAESKRLKSKDVQTSSDQLSLRDDASDSENTLNGLANHENLDLVNISRRIVLPVVETQPSYAKPVASGLSPYNWMA
jgi:hypothetical protein